MPSKGCIFEMGQKCQNFEQYVLELKKHRLDEIKL